MQMLLWQAGTCANSRDRLRREFDPDFLRRDREKKRKWNQKNKEKRSQARRENKKLKQIPLWLAVNSASEKDKLREQFKGKKSKKMGRPVMYASHADACRAWKEKIRRDDYSRWLNKRRIEKAKAREARRIRLYGSPEPRVSTGFNSSHPGYLYLCKRYDAVKVGITNREPRFRVSEFYEFDLIDYIYCQDGRRIRDMESEIKRKLKLNGIPTGSEAWRDRFDGYTEAWPIVELDVSTIGELLDRLGCGVKIGGMGQNNLVVSP